jgi:hypothetical protein
VNVRDWLAGMEIEGKVKLMVPVAPLEGVVVGAPRSPPGTGLAA